MLDLGISIINYKTKELTSKCLNSILNRKWKINFKIWLIDNNSEDGSVEYFKKNFPGVELVGSKSNLGFAGGHNLALKQIQARYVLILNSDAEVLDESLDKMVEFMDQHQDVGVASCKVLGFDGKLQPNGGDFPTGIALFSWLFNLESIGIKKPAFHRNEEGYYNNQHEVGWVSGNFMMVRAEVLKKVGYLNDDYFMYFEDAEFCYRVKKEGYKVMLNSDTSIKHLSGGSLDHPHLRQWTGEYKGLILFYSQHFGLLGEMGVRLLIYIATFLRVVAFAAVGKFSYSKTYAKVITSI